MSRVLGRVDVQNVGIICGAFAELLSRNLEDFPIGSLAADQRQHLARGIFNAAGREAKRAEKTGEHCIRDVFVRVRERIIEAFGKEAMFDPDKYAFDLVFFNYWDGRWDECEREFERLRDELSSIEGRLLSCLKNETVDSGRKISSPSNPSIPKAALRAGRQFEEACADAERMGGRLSLKTDQEAYDYFKKHLLEEESWEKLPKFATWNRNLRTYRNATDKQKNKSRRGRKGGSVITQDQRE
jgi:hypothetical protein